MTNKSQSAKQPKSPAGDAGPRSCAKPKTTKKAQLIKLLSAKSGVDLATLSEKLGWQPHTTRAAMSGLRKAGHTIELKPSSNSRPSRYRIIGGTQTETVK